MRAGKLYFLTFKSHTRKPWLMTALAGFQNPCIIEKLLDGASQKEAPQRK
jgi:hypothetical protein